MIDDNSMTEYVTYHCYDCGGIWSADGVDVFTTKDSTKYICKECRGRCMPKEEIKKVVGVKSIKQNFRKKRIWVYVLAGLIIFGFYSFYDRRVTVTDYKNYLVDTAIVRKSINAKLNTFKDDYKIVQSAKKTGKNDEKVKQAQDRIYKAKKYIFSKSNEIDDISKPEKSEIIELYELETSFWRDPSYIKYMAYQGVFNDLKNKYGNDLFEKLIDSVRSRLEKKPNKKSK